MKHLMSEKFQIFDQSSHSYQIIYNLFTLNGVSNLAENGNWSIFMAENGKVVHISEDSETKKVKKE